MEGGHELGSVGWWRGWGWPRFVGCQGEAMAAVVGGEERERLGGCALREGGEAMGRGEWAGWPNMGWIGEAVDWGGWGRRMLFFFSF